jgi:molybdenum cofactor cytidylyltransferase
MTDETIRYTAVITAAGNGERMGGPKALLAIRWGEGPGELPLAIAHARAHLDWGAARVVLVVRAKIARVLSGFAQQHLDLVVSTKEDAEGPRGSIRTALELVEAEPDAWFLIEPVDMPPASLAIVRELLRGASSTPTPAAVRPAFGGRRGHPVMIRRRFLDRLASGEVESLRQLLEALASEATTGGPPVATVEVPDVRAVTSFDTPAELEAWYGRPTKFFLEDDPTQA